MGHVTKLEESPLKPFDTFKSHFTRPTPVATHTTLPFITFLKLYLRPPQPPEFGCQGWPKEGLMYIIERATLLLDAIIIYQELNGLVSGPVAYPGILFSGGVQQIQLRTEDRENGDLGAVAR